MQADVLVISGQSLPPRLVVGFGGLRGVAATAVADAGRVEVNGTFADVRGVDVPLPAGRVGR